MYLILFGLWLVFNGQWTTEIAVTGAIVAALVYAFTCKFIGLSPKKELQGIKLLGKGFSYLVFLLREIVKANFAVLHLIYSPRLVIEPELHTFHTTLRTPLGKVALANSITLTPGTITVHLRDDLLMVHCLDSNMAEGLENSAFEQRIALLEGEIK